MPAEPSQLTSSSIGFNPEYGEEAPTLEQVGALADNAILEFGTPWCGHCEAAQPAMREALQAHPGITHIKVYDGKGKPLGRAFGVKQWPTLIRLHNGRETGRLVRPTATKDILALLRA